MDWVQNKSSGKKNRSSRKAKESNPIPATARGWLEDLCHENIALLQASLPVPRPQATRRKGDGNAVPLAQAMEWGVTTLDVEDKVDLETLRGLVDVLSLQDGEEVVSQDWKPERIAKWIGKQLPLRSEEPIVALIAAGWVHGLPKLGKSLEPGLWIETLQTILTQVDRSWATQEPESMLAWMVWSCEVPLALASQLSHLGCNDRIVSDTLDRLALVLELGKEKPSPWLKRGASDLRALLACTIRCRWTADRLGARKWYSSQRKAMVDLASKAIGLCDFEGKPLLQDSEDSDTDAGLWSALWEVTGRNVKLAHAMETLPKSLRPSELKKARSGKDPSMPLGFYDEGSELAWMRREWKSQGCRIAIDFARDPMWLDVLDAKGHRLLSGWWEVQVSKNKRPLDIDCGWSEVCWFNDDDVDYLELQCEVEGSCIIQRQILLARSEGLVFVADALIAEEEHDWELESTFPLAHSVQFMQETKSREGFLVREGGDDEVLNRGGLVMPVAMPEWKKLNCAGELLQEGENLVLIQRGRAKRLYSPLAIALKRRHQTASYTWRQLTVAEELQILPREAAVAYRLQIGREQWVMYRSLTPSTRRTAMGLHLSSEFYAGRFDSEEGTYEALVEVDANEEST